MKYDHMVKINGKYYSSGEDAPEKLFSVENIRKESSTSENAENNAKYYGEIERQYTKTEINRMSTSELQNLAAELGLENAFDKSGGELKKLLIEKFKL